ncbi:MAG: hypothetical protein WC705_03070 [Candidatus Paceibacterota bacterium]|jgi:hypothetical protein
MAKESNLRKKKQNTSVAERLIKVINKQPRTAEEFRKEIKDKLGHNEKPEDIRVNLLYLLRREKIKRKKEGSVYKYYI